LKKGGSIWKFRSAIRKARRSARRSARRNRARLTVLVRLRVSNLLKRALKARSKRHALRIMKVVKAIVWKRTQAVKKALRKARGHHARWSFGMKYFANLRVLAKTWKAIRILKRRGSSKWAWKRAIRKARKVARRNLRISVAKVILANKKRNVRELRRAFRTKSRAKRFRILNSMERRLSRKFIALHLAIRPTKKGSFRRFAVLKAIKSCKRLLKLVRKVQRICDRHGSMRKVRRALRRAIRSARKAARNARKIVILIKKRKLGRAIARWRRRRHHRLHRHRRVHLGRTRSVHAFASFKKFKKAARHNARVLAHAIRVRGHPINVLKLVGKAIRHQRCMVLRTKLAIANAHDPEVRARHARAHAKAFRTLANYRRLKTALLNKKWAVASHAINTVVRRYTRTSSRFIGGSGSVRRWRR